jgi:hypothetical protein
MNPFEFRCKACPYCVSAELSGVVNNEGQLDLEYASRLWPCPNCGGEMVLRLITREVPDDLAEEEAEVSAMREDPC